ncbi:hypothetical protein RB653_001934 [Dictyostelium firmibasis]|uniref:Palmitoyltransferase n=1 Tax=Dictyostelium firmibasis TaxID=79012 RepID=A0AAN7YV90_9MYCE
MSKFNIRGIVKRCDDYGKLLNRFCGPIFVGFATSLISLIAFTYFTIIFPATTSLSGLFSIFNFFCDLSISLFLTYGIYFNYIKAIITKPGYPHLNETSSSINVLYSLVYNNNDNDIINKESETIIIDNVTWSYCKKCSKSKPPRCHHCSVCDRCILKMDHHCPWIGGCVGFYNYRYFFLFLSYLWVSVCYVLTHSLPLLFGGGGYLYSKRFTEIDRLLVIISSIGSFITFVAVGSFGGFHAYLIGSGQTSIENLYPPKKRPNYSLSSIKDNFEIVLGKGEYWFSGLLPLNYVPSGNGCDFKLNPSQNHFKNENENRNKNEIKGSDDDENSNCKNGDKDSISENDNLISYDTDNINSK